MRKILLLLLSATSLLATAATYEVRVPLSVAEQSSFLINTNATAEELGDIEYIESLIGEKEWIICYDSGNGALIGIDYHIGCDGKGATVTIAEYNGKKFGGYSPIDTGSADGYHGAPTARIFDLTNQISAAPTGQYSGSRDVYVKAGAGPAWGWGHDLRLYDNSDNYGSCDGGNTYPGWEAINCGGISGAHVAFTGHTIARVYEVN
jgi:hypothetical protein